MPHSLFILFTALFFVLLCFWFTGSGAAALLNIVCSLQAVVALPLPVTGCQSLGASHCQWVPVTGSWAPVTGPAPVWVA